MTNYESHIMRITSPLETQSHRDSVTSPGKKLDFMFLYSSNRPLTNLGSGQPTCRVFICLFVLAATAAEHNSRTSQLCHLTIRRERKGKWLHFSSLSLLTKLLFPRKYFSKLSTQCVWGSWHLHQAQSEDVDLTVQEEMQGKQKCCKSPPACNGRALMKSSECERPYQHRWCPDSSQGQLFEERCCLLTTRHVPAPSKPPGLFANFHRTSCNQDTPDEVKTERTWSPWSYMLPLLFTE